MPALVDIGQRLLDRFTVAKEVTKSYLSNEYREIASSIKRGVPKGDELIYMTKSPDYCTKDERMGSMGTTGR